MYCFVKLFNTMKICFTINERGIYWLKKQNKTKSVCKLSAVPGRPEGAKQACNYCINHLMIYFPFTAKVSTLQIEK